MAAGLVEELLERVGGEDGEVEVGVGDPLRGAVRERARAVVGHLDAARLERGVDLVGLVLVEAEMLDELGDLGLVDAAALLGAREQGFEVSRREGHLGTWVPSARPGESGPGDEQRIGRDAVLRRRGVADVGAVDLDPERAAVG